MVALRMVATSCYLPLNTCSSSKQDLTFLFSISSVQNSCVSRVPAVVHSGSLNTAALQDLMEVSLPASLSGGSQGAQYDVGEDPRPVVRGVHAEPDAGSHLPSLYRMDVMLSLEHPLISLGLY